MPRSRTGEACHARSTSCTHACPAVTARKVFFATAASSYPVRNPKGQVSQILTMPQAPWDTGRGLGVGGREGGRGGGGGLPDEHVAFHSLPVPFRAEACDGGGGEGVGPRTFVHTLPVLVVRPVCAPLRAPQAVSPAPPPPSPPPHLPLPPRPPRPPAPAPGGLTTCRPRLAILPPAPAPAPPPPLFGGAAADGLAGGSFAPTPAAWMSAFLPLASSAADLSSRFSCIKNIELRAGRARGVRTGVSRSRVPRTARPGVTGARRLHGRTPGRSSRTCGPRGRAARPGIPASRRGASSGRRRGRSCR